MNVIETGGINLDDISKNPQHMLILKHLMMKLQKNLESCFSSIACIVNSDSVVLCDKGLMDIKVDMKEET